MRDLIIVGHSGFSKEIAWLINRRNEIEHRWDILGFVDTEPGEDVLGDDEYLMNRNIRTDVVIAIGDTKLRTELYDKFRIMIALIFQRLLIQVSRCLIQSDLV